MQAGRPYTFFDLRTGTTMMMGISKVRDWADRFGVFRNICYRMSRIQTGGYGENNFSQWMFIYSVILAREDGQQNSDHRTGTALMDGSSSRQD